MSGETEAKAALRERMRGLRAGIPETERARLAAAAEDRLLALEEVREAHDVLLFYSFGSEVATEGTASRLHAAGKRLLLPYLDREGMEAAEVRPGEPPAPTGYGPKEPGRRVPVDPAEVGLVVAPGLAFDRDGRRLGYGGGHYDRYLARLRPAAVRVGVCFSLQLVEAVPVGPLDEPVHLVVTDAEVVDCRA